MRTTPPTIRPIKHGSHADDCLWVDHVRWQPQTLYNSTQLQDGLDTDLNVYTIGTVWNMCDWPQKSYTVSGAGTHSLMWQYIKDNRTADGSDRGWVDYLQWTPGAGGASTGWEEITYTYDPAGRRIAKDVDGVVTKYVYDGAQCIAEYDGDDVLLRKFIHGPCIDEPICMIEAAGSYAGTYYYHYDALGSVVALSDADGETVQVYEYDVYGQPGVADAGHPNPFAFTGRRFDTETGLYYYRARYYNPTIGRFLQTDPIGYQDGMNWYAYCRNNPITWIDPTGLLCVAFYDGAHPTHGNIYRKCADDKPPFDISVSMSEYAGYGYDDPGSFMVAFLAHLKEMGKDVTEVYFFSHGIDPCVDEGIDLCGFWYTLNGPTDEYPEDRSLLGFVAAVAGVVRPDDPETQDYDGTALHFRQCNAGIYAEVMAAHSGLQVTGFTGRVTHIIDNFPGYEYGEPPGPDYYGAGMRNPPDLVPDERYVVATPGQETQYYIDYVGY
ncbi:RHS repeat-associated core domain-containing protein [Anaerobaca lacustris]|uniref:RHS repeat-associated core domain-containing protein n=1 Tax=Anaerobaca lacustris TaxID=3044600 RepID=A0AAW6TWZ8_9BACT|nr:RHS repeat-associated core domain-containing protein [Sedimentisphaerales bacterium M17dextr]